MRHIYIVLLFTTPLLAAEPKVYRRVPFVEAGHKRQFVDVYTPAQGKGHPVVVWICFMSWSEGLASSGYRHGEIPGLQKKPEAFVEKGFVFVAANHRIFPEASVKGIAGDIAKAIHWTHDQVTNYGGDPNTIIVMGDAAGGHLAALICTDERYLKAEGVPLSNIKGCLVIDSVFDIPRWNKHKGARPWEAVEYAGGLGGFPAVSITGLFGESEESQRELSPLTYVTNGKAIPPFLILYWQSGGTDGKPQQDFADHLKQAGISAAVVEDKGGGITIASRLGTPEDISTKAMWKFLDGVLKK